MSWTTPRPDGLREDQYDTPQSYLAREHRVLNLRGPIVDMGARWDNFSAVAVMDSIEAMNRENPDAPIWLFINSPGGSVSEGFILYDTIKMSTAPIYTMTQQAASMATVIMAAGDRRYLYPHARVMMHLPRGVVGGDSREIEIQTAEMKQLETNLVDVYRENGVNKSSADILEDIDREMWLSAEEVIEYGLADEVLSRELFTKVRSGDI